MTTTPDRLLAAATELFAARGFDGASVRAICEAAEANLNAVSYHFGGKRGLYTAVIRGVGDRRLASAQRVLGTPARDTAELETRLLVFAEETLAAWMSEPGVLSILFAEIQQGFRNCEQDAIDSLTEQNRVLLAFLQSAQEAGMLRSGLDLAILAGALLERLNSQALHADTVHELHGTSVKNAEYREHWVRQTVDLFLHGAMAR